ncbi:MAG: hypothetical protein AAGB00_10220 [Planctomycetota bacterium]
MRPVRHALVVLAAFALSPAAALSQAPGGQLAPPAAPRLFAPGVLEVIPPDLNPEEATSVHDIVELRSIRGLNWSPQLLAKSETIYSKSADVRFRRGVWQLEFAFKPLRMMWVQLPKPSGEMEKRLLWYLVFRVTNRGDAITPTEEEGGFFDAKKAPAGPQRFVSQFVLEGHDVDAAGNKLYRAYLDRLIPAAIEPIRRREVPGRKLLSTVELAKQAIPISTEDNEQSVWAVATWTDIDPEMDFFSVFVRGLTNAYRWEDPEGAYRAGDPPGKGRRFVRKTLQLNFWRPGDQFLPHESEIRFGAAPGREALYGVGEGVAYRWVYR